MIYNTKINLGYDQVLKAFEDKLPEIKFGILAKIDIPLKLQEKGYDFSRNFTIFEICNPSKAKEVLDIDLEVAYFLPCKVIILDEGMNTSIGFVKPTSLISNFGNEKLNKIALEIEESIIQVIEKIKL